MANPFRKKKEADPSIPMPAAPDSKEPFSRIWVPLLLALVAFLAYWPSLKSDFVYDARLEILEEGFITSLSNLPDVLSLKVLGMNIVLGLRPGQLLYLMLNAAIWGKEPFGYHLSSNLLHAANVALLYVLLRRLIAPEITGLARSSALKVRLAIAAVTLIFALHPIAVESVAEISYSSSLLVTFFTLLALLAAMAFRPENFRTAMITGSAGVFCAFAAVTSKESGVTTALLLIVYWFLFRRKETRLPWLLFLGAAIAVTGAFLAARFLLAAPPGQPSMGYLGGSLPRVFLIQPRLWVFMMGKLFWPVQLSADYAPDNVYGLSIPVAMVILIVVVLLQAWLACKSRLGALGVALYWLALATVSNFVPLYRPMADRFYYLPMAGFAMQLLALLLMTLKSSRGFWMAVIPCMGALLPLALLTLIREDVFANDFSLWQDTLRVNPSATAYSNLGNILYSRGQVDEAIVQFKKALETDPDYALAHYDYGLALIKKGQLDDAIAEFKSALEIRPAYAAAENDLGMAFSQKGQLDDAMAHFQKALEINPNLADAHNNLGLALSKKGRVDEALAEYQKVLKIDPDSVKAYNRIGISLFQKGQLNEAIAQFKKALEIDPGYTDASNNLSKILSQKNQEGEATSQSQTASKINPTDAKALNNYGLALLQKGQVDEALPQFQKALKINPNFADAHNNLGLALSKKGQMDEAMAQFQKALELDPGHAQAHYNLGVLFLQKGQTDQAMAQCKKALEINPDYAQAHNGLGAILFQKGQLDEAIVQFQETLRLNPSNTNAQNNLAKVKALLQQKADSK